MHNNFFRISLRHFWRNKGYTIINAFGLTVGTVCCLYAILYVTGQSGYDDYHHSATGIYRVTSEVVEPGGDPFNIATSSPPVAEALGQDFPEIELTTRLFKDPGVEQYLLKADTRSFYETKGYFADSSFLRVFTYHLVEGSASKALEDPFTVVLSRSTARKLFGDDTALDKSITINGDLYRITAVFDDSRVKSHIRANFFMSFRNKGMTEFIRTSNEWIGQNLVYTYITLRPEAQASALEEKLSDFMKRHAKEQLERMNVKLKKTLHLQKVSAIHSTSQLDSELERNANPAYIRMVLIIAFLIQLMACINFMNLTTARLSSRAREIGVRKAVGASRESLIGWFIGESLMLSTIAGIAATGIVWVTVPDVNGMFGIDIDHSFLNNLDTYLILLGVIVITGALAGAYPAFHMSVIKASHAFKGYVTKGTTGFSLRKALVIIQFVVSVTLIMCIVIISQQLSYLQTKELGFTYEQKIVFPLRVSESKENQKAFRSQIEAMPQVKRVSGAAYYPSHWLGETMPVFYQGRHERKGTGIWVNRVDDEYLQTLQIPLLAGRNFNRSDSSAQVIVNETALRELSIPMDNAIGGQLLFAYRDMEATYTIIGVVKDFDFRSLREPMRPMMFQSATEFNYLIADVEARDLPTLLSDLEKAWNRFIPEVPFEYTFLEDDIRQQYEADNIFRSIVNILALVAISIACLGLFSLATYTAGQRTKEICIRKVMGAGAGNIVKLLTTDFLMLVFVAIVLSVPLSWYGTHQWLQTFTNRITIEWWMFAWAGLAAIFVALLTILFQTIKVSLVNPAQALRND